MVIVSPISRMFADAVSNWPAVFGVSLARGDCGKMIHFARFLRQPRRFFRRRGLLGENGPFCPVSLLEGKNGPFWPKNFRLGKRAESGQFMSIL